MKSNIKPDGSFTDAQIKHNLPLTYSTTEAAQAAGISRSLMYEEMKAGRGPKVCKIGRRTIITRKSLEEWLDSLEQQSNKQAMA